MKFYRHSSLLERILSEDDLYSVDLSPNDFESVLHEVSNLHYDHGRYNDFEYNSNINFEVNGIGFNLVEDEPDA